LIFEAPATAPRLFLEGVPMAELLSSRVVIEEEEPRVRQLPTLATSIAGFVGVTERGPVGEKKLVTSFAEFQRMFGGFHPSSELVPAVQGFFDNGGKRAWIVRTVHYTDPALRTSKTSDAATKNLTTAALAATSGKSTGTIAGPWALAHGDTVKVKLNGGGAVTATIQGTAPSKTCGVGPYDLADGDTLTLKINRGALQTVTFNTASFVSIDAATAAEIAAVINASIVGGRATVVGGAVKIETDRKGTGAYLEITGGTSNAVLVFNTAEAQGTGNVSDLSAVTATQLKTIIEAAVAGCTVSASVDGYLVITSNTTGAGSSIQIDATSTADDELGFDNAVHSGSAAAQLDTLQVDAKYDGEYGNTIKIKIASPSSGKADEFKLQVLVSDVIVETFDNLSMDPDADRFVETIVNDEDTGSALVTVTDLAAATTDALAIPAAGTSTVMTGGDDGLAGLADTDFIGSAAGTTGLHALDTLTAADIQILAIPGRATSAVHNAMLTWCEVTRGGSCFAVLDPPASQTATQIVTYVRDTAAILGLTEFGAIYWPRVKVLNPDKAVYGKSSKTITVYPSGHIAGMFARVDGSRPGGVYQPPAGVEVGKLFGVIGLETEEVKDEAKRDVVFPNRINPITVEPGTPIYVDGARTLKATGNFPTVGERRGVIFVEQTAKAGLNVERHQSNTEELRARVDRSLRSFLIAQTKLGAFRSKDPSKAFFVDVGEGLNPPSEVFAGKLNARIGLATNKPAEFVILKFSQDVRALEAELQKAKA
jgi:phage tail sheath protein FI